MGLYFFDQYSLLHFCVGVVVYFLGIDFWTWFFIHLLFEIIENTPNGIYFIQTYLHWWPGKKLFPDSNLNKISDQFFGVSGWIFAFYFDKYGTKYNLVGY